ncbi:hypothetical protein BJ165DRAFT_1535566 [Panaeolus papilionaceus]|nr:hypothetical protein BJ165DRAFT_1535566 [Panaeolus papilionaceus]
MKTSSFTPQCNYSSGAHASGTGPREPATPSKSKKPVVHFRNFENHTLVFDSTESILSPQPSVRCDTLAMELQALQDEVAALHNLTRALSAQNATLHAGHEEMMDLLRSIQESISEMAPNGVTPPPDDDEEAELASTQPEFNPSSRTFYTIIKGRCPGIYSDLDWARFLITDLPHDERQWKSYTTYADALEAFLKGMARGVVEFTGHVRGDEHKYGPRVFYVPYPTVQAHKDHLSAKRSGQ